MHAFRIYVLFFLTSFASFAVAQAVAPLPKAMKGVWLSIYNGSDRNWNGAISVVLDGDGAPGPVTGRLTFHGVNCGALDEPLAGTWNGTEFRFEARLHPSVNTQFMNRRCSSNPWSFVLTRKPGRADFDGEAHRSTAPSFGVSLAP